MFIQTKLIFFRKLFLCHFILKMVYADLNGLAEVKKEEEAKFKKLMN